MKRLEEDEGDADIIRVTLIGPSQTGKSTFASSVVSRSVSRSGSGYHRTARNIVRYVQLRPRDPVGIHLEDTVGTNKINGESYDVARNQVFIILFDWSRPETKKLALDMVTEIRIAETQLKRRPPRPLILLGNKRDIASQEQDRELEKLKKAAYTGNFFLFSGSVVQNSFTLLEKPKRFEKNSQYFCRLYDITGLDDFRLNYTAIQLVENMRALFDDVCGVGWGIVDKAESQPLIPSASIKPKEDDEKEMSFCQRICGCCFRKQ